MCDRDLQWHAETGATVFRILDFLAWSIFFAVLLPSSVSHLATCAPYLVDPCEARKAAYQLQFKAEAEEFAYRRMLCLLRDLGEKCPRSESHPLGVTGP